MCGRYTQAAPLARVPRRSPRGVTRNTCIQNLRAASCYKRVHGRAAPSAVACTNGGFGWLDAYIGVGCLRVCCWLVGCRSPGWHESVRCDGVHALKTSTLAAGVFQRKGRRDASRGGAVRCGGVADVAAFPAPGADSTAVVPFDRGGPASCDYCLCRRRAERRAQVRRF